METAETIQKVGSHFGLEIVRHEQLSGGRNSQTFKVVTKSNEQAVIKFYFQQSNDLRARASTEFKAFRFLWDHEIKMVPEPLGFLESPSCAVFCFVEGQTLAGLGSAIDHDDILQVLQFVGALYKLSASSQAQDLPSASEACFSISDLCSVIEGRLQKLNAVQATNEELITALHTFLSSCLNPRYAKLKQGVMDFSYPSGFAFDSVLPNYCRTLSSSDFGFHNGLKLKDGTWIFLDFEYFGFDDPVKLIADFVLHPAMQLTSSSSSDFIKGAMEIFKADPHLSLRLKLLYPLYKIKWACIILNEFLPEFRARKGEARIDDQVRITLAERLTRAQALMAIDDIIHLPHEQ